MPPRYEIRIGGALTPPIADAFAGLEVVRAGDVTVVRGEFDQAALHGLLERIRMVGMELLDVRRARSPRGRAS